MQFRATLRLGGKTATGIAVPAAVVAGLGSSRRPAVRVTLKGHTYRSTVAPMGAVFMLPVSAEHRALAGVAAGDELDVDIVLDTEPREVTLPPDFAAALDQDDAARRFFDGLSFTNKRWHADRIAAAKKLETRQRRIADSVGLLRAGQPRR
jgi:Bacteriocin-protection, YdeI or OmpD-Associated/Domain of unknown function (DUF1905)